MIEISFGVTGFEQGGLSSKGEPTVSNIIVHSEILEIPAGMQNLTAVPEIWRKKWDSKSESYIIEKYEGSSASSSVYFYKENNDGTFEFLSSVSAKNVDCLKLSYLGATHARFTAGVSSSTIHPDDMEETKSSYYYIVQIDVNGTAVNWYYSNDRLTHEEMPDAPEKAMTKPYPKALWRVENGRLTHEILSDEIPEKAIKKPYPKALWRIDNKSPNMPYHELLPGIKGLDLWSLKRENIIRVYDFREPQDGFKHNGLAILAPSKCTSIHELNGRWDVELTHPLDDWGRWKFLLPQNVLKVDGQLFRIDEIEPDTQTMSIKVHAKHVWYDLADNILIHKSAKNLNGIEFINFVINSRVTKGIDWSYSFQYNSDIDDSRHDAEFENTSLVSALIGTEGCFVDLFGGELYRNNFYFSINSRMEKARDNAFCIRHGGDIEGISQKIDHSNWCTWLITEDNCGNAFAVSYSQAGAYHHNKFRYQKFTYSDENPDSSMKLDPFERLRKDAFKLWNQIWLPAVSYTVNIASMRKNPKYSDFLELQNYRVGDCGTIYCKMLNINTAQQIISIEKNELTGDVTNIKLGNTTDSLIRPYYRAGNVPILLTDDQQNQLEEIIFNSTVNCPIVSESSKYLVTLKGKYVLYGKE
ncbi:MAG: phage tail protein [Ruminococcus sp.]|nr:phage tail protein [Ruminococcus sp.]